MPPELADIPPKISTEAISFINFIFNAFKYTSRARYYIFFDNLHRPSRFFWGGIFGTIGLLGGLVLGGFGIYESLDFSLGMAFFAFIMILLGAEILFQFWWLGIWFLALGHAVSKYGFGDKNGKYWINSLVWNLIFSGTFLGLAFFSVWDSFDFWEAGVVAGLNVGGWLLGFVLSLFFQKTPFRYASSDALDAHLLDNNPYN
jgi:hypothetical protein